MSELMRQAALDAHAAGDAARVVACVEAIGQAALDDPLMLQLLALASPARPDEYALLRYAATGTTGVDASAWFNLAVVEQKLGALDRAQLRYEQVLRIDPFHLGALNNLSDLLRRRGFSQDAWRCITAYLDHDGDPAGLEVRIAKIADDCGLAAEARVWFARAVERGADNPAIVWERAMQQLRDEEFEQGWRGYEARRAIFSHAALAIVSYSATEWDGGALGDQSLLVHREQGLGDTIMFASCLEDVVAKESALHLAVQPHLVRLFQHNFPKAQVWASSSSEGFETEAHQPWRQVAGRIDRHIPFGSLPLHRRSQGFPAPKPYLTALPRDREIWRRRIQAMTPTSVRPLRAGLVITARRDGFTGAGIAEGAPKSLDARLAHPFAVPGIDWFGLHDRATADDLAALPGLRLLDTSEWLQDLADTAGLIDQLDVVVAVDTAVAHLAGAMGKKVLLMLRRNTDWRWGRTRADSYWYRDVEVFRQRTEGDWSPVCADIASRLVQLRETHASSAVDGEQRSGIDKT